MIAGLADDATMPLESFCELSHVLFSPQGNINAMGNDALVRVGRKRRVALTVQVFSGVCRAFRESYLIALIPEQSARDLADLSGLRVFRPPMQIDPALIIAIWHRKHDNAALAKWVRERVFKLLKPIDVTGFAPADDGSVCGF